MPGVQASLEDVLFTHELVHRSTRPPDLRAENQALHALARQLANAASQSMLRSLVQTALGLCRAGSAGVSQLETSGSEELVRWVVVAGAYQPFEGLTAPARLSASGFCLEQMAPQLYSYPTRHFTRFSTIEPTVMELLVLPFSVNEKPVGTIWVASHEPSRHFDSEDVRLMSSLADFTAAAMHSANLRESEEFNRRIFALFTQNLPGLAWMKDLQGRYVYANDAATRAFCTPRTQLYGRTDDEVFPPETAARFKENDRRALASEAGVQVIETLLHDDGVIHYSLVSKFPILGTDGRPALIGGMAIDITDRLRAEQALKEADRRKDEFLATLAHELRNPLAPIRNAVHMLQMAGNDRRVQEEASAMMERQLAQMVHLIDDLLDISRISRNKLELRKRSAALTEVVESAIETARPLIESWGHDLIVTLPDETVLFDADPTRLAQVFSNLLNNAARYTEQYGRIWLTAQREGNDALITVKDTGIGIPADKLESIFDMFTQVDRSLERRHGGLGIGLTLVKWIVEMHSGSVVAKSEGPGKGSEFIVRLPILTTQPGATACSGVRSQGPGVSTDGRRRRILIADDNEDAVDSLAFLLRRAGHEVQTAHNGVQAVAVAEAFRPEVALLDIGMPELNGYDVCRRLRERPWGQRIIFIALTGWGKAEDRSRTREAGFDYHLVKPVEPAELYRVLANVPIA